MGDKQCQQQYVKTWSIIVSNESFIYYFISQCHLFYKWDLAKVAAVQNHNIVKKKNIKMLTNYVWGFPAFFPCLHPVISHYFLAQVNTLFYIVKWLCQTFSLTTATGGWSPSPIQTNDLVFAEETCILVLQTHADIAEMREKHLLNLFMYYEHILHSSVQLFFFVKTYVTCSGEWPLLLEHHSSRHSQTCINFREVREVFYTLQLKL